MGGSLHIHLSCFGLDSRYLLRISCLMQLDGVCASGVRSSFWYRAGISFSVSSVLCVWILGVVVWSYLQLVD